MSITLIFLIITGIISFSAFSNPKITSAFLFYPWSIKRENQWYRFITYAFVHGDFMHLLINMWVFYIFGSVVENSFIMIYGTNGKLYYILLYISGIIFSTFYSYARNKDNPNYSALGASGGVSAITFAYIFIFPLSSLYIFPFPFRIPAIVFGVLYLIYSWLMAKRGKDNIGHDAHFFGALYGIVFMIILDYRFAILFWNTVF
ncbi:MAG: rhomboid family intramembrane serine protease [Bacteroidales bacterium]|jgi:membrane associated rhomboid family serine protease|nr:rhomboid family intramembrane serine protease [Bacteroidales bacterium]